MLIFLIVMCVVFGLVVFGIFTFGMLRGDSDRGDPGFRGGLGYRSSGSDYGVMNPPRIRELSPGCLLTIIVVGSIWFIMWGIVLLLALRLLRTPLD